MAFKTPLETHRAFYQALETGDLALMKQAWGQGENLVCIHPLWPALIGHKSIFSAWAQMFHPDNKIQVIATLVSEQTLQHSCTHLVEESLGHINEPMQSKVLATNGYQLTDQGWVMVLHHASPTSNSAQVPTQTPLH
jgi:hypothetical protein